MAPKKAAAFAGTLFHWSMSEEGLGAGLVEMELRRSAREWSLEELRARERPSLGRKR